MGTTLTATGNLKRAGLESGIRGILWFLFPLSAVLIYRQALRVARSWQALNAISFTATHGGALLVALPIAAAIGIPLVLR